MKLVKVILGDKVQIIIDVVNPVVGTISQINRKKNIFFMDEYKYPVSLNDIVLLNGIEYINNELTFHDIGLEDLPDVDLRTCKKGDTLISKHGAELKYIKPLPEGDYMDHEVEYIKGEHRGYGSRTDNGQVFKKKRFQTDHEIVKIIRK